jgi:hypothetical protein
MRALPADVHRVEAHLARQGLLDAGDGFEQPGLRHVVRKLHAASRKNQRPAPERGNRVAGLQDGFDPLMGPVELNALLIRSTTPSRPSSSSPSTAWATSSSAENSDTGTPTPKLRHWAGRGFASAR